MARAVVETVNLSLGFGPSAPSLCRMVESVSNTDMPSLLSGASPELLALIDGGLAPVSLAAGQTLFDQGEFDDRLYLLDDGLLEVSVLSAGGRRLALNQLRPGSVFGEIAIFDPGPRTARVDALAPSRLRAIRQGTLMTGLSDVPDLAEELLRIAGRRMRWMSRQVEDQVFLPPASRLACKLLYLAGEGNEVVLSQASLADYVGVTREVVSKTLSDWRRSGIVALSRGRISLIDRDALFEIMTADFV